MTIPKKARDLFEKSGTRKYLSDKEYKLLLRDKTPKQWDELEEIMRNALLDIKLCIYSEKTTDEDYDKVMRRHILILKGLLSDQDDRRVWRITIKMVLTNSKYSYFDILSYRKLG
jgi:hypothetical protein